MLRRRTAAARSRRRPARPSTSACPTRSPSSRRHAEAWAEFFVAPHARARSSSQLTAYIATFDEVQEICGTHALGCYGRDELVAPGEAVLDDVVRGDRPPRVRPPHRRPSSERRRGTRSTGVRSAGRAPRTSVLGSPARRPTRATRARTTRVNPGEAWAEVYRLDGRAQGRNHDRDVVDHRAELLPGRGRSHGGRAGRDPAVDSAAPDGSTRGPSGSGRRRVWWISLSTPLDGNVRVSATVPGRGDGSVEIALVGPNRQTVVRRAHWVGQRVKTARRLGLRSAVAVRPCHAEGAHRKGARLGDDCVRRIAAAGALVALLACAGAAAGSPSDPGAHALRRSPAKAPRTLRASSAGPAALTAWCGAAAQSDRVPNVVAGNPVHWVYLIPSDGADSLGSVATVMQSDAEQVDAWWREQDATRAPRNDLTAFSCGTQLDITTVRSTLSGSQLAPLDERFAGIFQTMQQAGLTSSFTKYLVYYDGPATRTTSAGRAAARIRPEASGLAVVFYRSCVGISTAVGRRPRVPAHDRRGPERRAARLHRRHERSHLRQRGGHHVPVHRGRTAFRRSCSIPDGTTTTGIRERGRTRRTRRGSCGSMSRRRWPSRSPARARLRPTCPVCSAPPTCTTTWNTGQHLELAATPGTGAKLVRWAGRVLRERTVRGDRRTGPRRLGAVRAGCLPAHRLRQGQRDRSAAPGGIQCRPRCSATPPVVLARHG